MLLTIARKVLCKIIRERMEWNTGLYMFFFVDFENAFDSVDRDVLQKIVRQYGVLRKFTKASKQDFCMKVI